MKNDDVIREWQKAAETKIPGGLSLEKHNILLETLCDIMAAELLNAGGEISLPGLGKLKTVRQGTRTGRNPRTGEQISIPARRQVKFVPGKSLSEALKGDRK